jgi:alpha-mannosidase
MRISGVSSTDLFAGTTARPLQIVRVMLAGESRGRAADPGAAITVRVAGAGVTTPEPVLVPAPPPGAEVTAEVGVQVAAPAQPGGTRPVTVIAERAGDRAESQARLTVAEPGWTMWMVSHFHYDPVWWSTQGQFLESRLILPGDDGQLPEVRTAFELVSLHLDAARADPDYKFVLAEVDYLKPHFDAHPEDRRDLLDFIAAGRIELVGGSYNEPNTNLTCAESTIRNAVYGVAYQRDVLGGDPRISWMLDAFGFDPAYPGLMAAAGMTESSWARGPFHQWGPMRTAGDNRLMQFAAEFEWLSPDGSGLLTSYMANHYSAGWGTQHAADLATAERDAYEQFRQLAPVAATRNVLLPVGGDHVIPSRWAAAIHRDWNARYVWPRFVTGLPGEFFAAVRRDAADRDIWITPQTRDMNPVYTGKDVSFIDTKQGQRAAETAVLDGERLATLAWLAGARYPAASLDKAWHQLVFGAHHDAITGTEGDQVYLDLVAGWREAYERGRAARRAAISYLAARADTAAAARAAGAGAAGRGGEPMAIVVVNSLSAGRPGLVEAELELAGTGARWLELRDDTGAPRPFLAEGIQRSADGSLAALTLKFRAAQVPGVGYRTYLVLPSAAEPADPGWRPAPGARIENEAFAVTADPSRGGTLSSILDKRSGTELLTGPGNQLMLQEEHPAHPRWREGPWLLCPKGMGIVSAGAPARLRAERCPVGSRLVAELDLGDLRITQETLLWDGAERVEFRTHADGSIGRDRLLRVGFPVRVPGGLPVYQTALSVIGRPLGTADMDVAEHSFTLDNPAHEWFGLGSAARVALTGPDGERQLQAIGVAEVITPPVPARPGRADGDGTGAGTGTGAANPGSRESVRDLLTALAQCGVTATCSVPDGPRYGAIEIDSNLPDFRLLLGGPEQNAVTAAVLASAEAAVAELARQLKEAGSARVWVPALRSRHDAFAPGADVRGARDLPVLIVAAADLEAATAALVDDLSDAVIEVPAAGAVPWHQDAAGSPDTALGPQTVALLNRGTPSSLVSPDGMLSIALMRSCSTWPCGVWIDGEKRTVPDGTSFAWQHWSHTFEYALAAGQGDWRSAGFPLAGQDYNHDLLAITSDLHDGPLPAAASLAAVEPPTAMLAALKPRGNPLAPGVPPSPADGVTVRLRDVSGKTAATPASVRLFTGIAGARASDLREDSEREPLPLRDGAAVTELPAAGVVTLAVTPAPAPPAPSGPAPAGSAPAAVTAPTARPVATAGEAADSPPEPAQPVHARYWLHGKGPAPAGNLPAAVHLTPGRLALDGPAAGDLTAGGPPAAGPASGGPAATGRASAGHPAGLGRAGQLQLTVSGGPEGAAGAVRLVVPAGLSVEPAGPLAFDLASRGHARWDLTVRGRADAAGGRYFVAAQIDDDLGQVIEDTALITIGQHPAPSRELPRAQVGPLRDADQQAQAAEAELAVAATTLALGPGETGEIAVSLRNATASGLRGEAQLVSPFGSWDLVRPWTLGFSVSAGKTATLRFAVTVPAAARPGQHWWAIVKVMYFGRVRYTEPVAVTVGG